MADPSTPVTFTVDELDLGITKGALVNAETVAEGAHVSAVYGSGTVQHSAQESNAIPMGHVTGSPNNADKGANAYWTGTADADEEKVWHGRMIGFVEAILQSLGLPYRLLQCCTGDLGQKNEDMIDVECWMPGRGADGPDGRPVGDWGETHSASRLADYQCRRLNLRYRDPETKKTVFAYSLNNTVAASPRILIPILEMHQQADGSVAIPAALQPYMGGMTTITPR